MKAAIFDVDSTIIDIPSERRFIRYLIRKRPLFVIRLLFYLLVFSIRNIKRFNLYMFRKFFIYLKGYDEKTYEKLAKRCFNEVIKSHFYPKALDLIKSFKDKGYEIFLITGSLSFIAINIKEYVGADHLLATELVVKDGRFTGEVKQFPFDIEKAIILKRLARKHKIDLKKSYAYGDHYTDIHILNLVGHPVAANPGPRLKLYAKKNGWDIVYF